MNIDHSKSINFVADTVHNIYYITLAKILFYNNIVQLRHDADLTATAIGPDSRNLL